MLFAATACSSGSSTTTPKTTVLPATSTTAASTTTALPRTPGTTTNIGHVFVINLENEDYATTWGPSSPATTSTPPSAPKVSCSPSTSPSVTRASTTTSPRSAAKHPIPTPRRLCHLQRLRHDRHRRVRTGARQRLRVPDIGEDDRRSTRRRPQDLEGVRRRHRKLADRTQDVPAPCARHGRQDLLAPKGDLYVTRHDPFVYFHSIIDSPAAQERRRPEGLATDLQSAATTPNLSYITPNVCNDGHDAPCNNGKPGGLDSADAWLEAVGTENSGVTRVQSRRHARHHAGRSTNRERARRRQRMLSHAAVAERHLSPACPVPGAEMSVRSSCRRSRSRARRTSRPTTTTPCCAASRTSGLSAISASPARQA